MSVPTTVKPILDNSDSVPTACDGHQCPTDTPCFQDLFCRPAVDFNGDNCPDGTKGGCYCAAGSTDCSSSSPTPPAPAPAPPSSCMDDKQNDLCPDGQWCGFKDETNPNQGSECKSCDEAIGLGDFCGTTKCDPNLKCKDGYGCVDQYLQGPQCEAEKYCMISEIQCGREDCYITESTECTGNADCASDEGCVFEIGVPHTNGVCAKYSCKWDGTGAQITGKTHFIGAGMTCCKGVPAGSRPYCETDADCTKYLDGPFICHKDDPSSSSGTCLPGKPIEPPLYRCDSSYQDFGEEGGYCNAPHQYGNDGDAMCCGKGCQNCSAGCFDYKYQVVTLPPTSPGSKPVYACDTSKTQPPAPTPAPPAPTPAPPAPTPAPPAPTPSDIPTIGHCSGVPLNAQGRGRPCLTDHDCTMGNGGKTAKLTEESKTNELYYHKCEDGACANNGASCSSDMDPACAFNRNEYCQGASSPRQGDPILPRPKESCVDGQTDDCTWKECPAACSNSSYDGSVNGSPLINGKCIRYDHKGVCYFDKNLGWKDDFTDCTSCVAGGDGVCRPAEIKDFGVCDKTTPYNTGLYRCIVDDETTLSNPRCVPVMNGGTSKSTCEESCGKEMHGGHGWVTPGQLKEMIKEDNKSWIDGAIDTISQAGKGARDTYCDAFPLANMCTISWIGDLF